MALLRACDREDVTVSLRNRKDISGILWRVRVAVQFIRELEQEMLNRE